MRDVVNATAERVFSESQRIVPVDTGNLKGSGRVTPTDAGGLVAKVSYGGTGAKYALIVHETHAYGGRKYLERPAREALKRFVQDVRAAVKGQ